MKNTIIKDTIILTLITLIAGGILGLVYEITKLLLPNSRNWQNRKPIKQFLKMQILLKYA